MMAFAPYIRQISLPVCLVLLGWVGSALAQGSFESTYTSVEPQHCRTIPPATNHNPETDGPEEYEAICPGIHGYTLRVEEGDLRPFVSVVTPSGAEHKLHLVPYASGFSNLGPRAEWRMVRDGNRQRPIALILRVVEVTDPIPQPPPTISRLVVTKITDDRVCVIGAVPPGARQNELARQMADTATTVPCIPEE